MIQKFKAPDSLTSSWFECLKQCYRIKVWWSVLCSCTSSNKHLNLLWLNVTPLAEYVKYKSFMFIISLCGGGNIFQWSEGNRKLHFILLFLLISVIVCVSAAGCPVRILMWRITECIKHICTCPTVNVSGEVKDVLSQISDHSLWVCWVPAAQLFLQSAGKLYVRLHPYFVPEKCSWAPDPLRAVLSQALPVSCLHGSDCCLGSEEETPPLSDF